MSDKRLNLYQKIIEVMKEVKAIQKENKKVNGQYTFVSHDAVAAALHMPLATNGIVMVPSISELVQDGNRTIIKMEISFINADNPEERITSIYYGYGIDAQDKGIGKAISYAVKYALLKTFCLETGDDVERDAGKEFDHSTKDQELKKEQATVIRSQILKDIPEEDHDFFEKYIVAVMNHLKIPYENSILKISQKPDIKKDFYAWKSNQKEQKKAA